jgi:hypothetical protein
MSLVPVQIRDQFPVGGSGRTEFLVAFLDLAAQVDDLLFQLCDQRCSWSMSAGAPRPDSRQVCSPSSSESFFSNCRMRAVWRVI